jgi:hypothetical protein
LLWSDIALDDDLDAATLTIAHNRLSVVAAASLQRVVTPS